MCFLDPTISSLYKQSVGDVECCGMSDSTTNSVSDRFASDRFQRHVSQRGKRDDVMPEDCWIVPPTKEKKKKKGGGGGGGGGGRKKKENATKPTNSGKRPSSLKDLVQEAWEDAKKAIKDIF